MRYVRVPDFAEPADVVVKVNGARVDTTARAGYVAVDDPRVVPSEFLFRTGGVGTVRGYSFQSLGAIEGASVTGSTTMAVASAEYVRWLVDDWGAAVFVDAGEASNDLFSEPLARGYGVGARYRTLAGPLALDVAWANRTQTYRVHFFISSPSEMEATPAAPPPAPAPRPQRRLLALPAEVQQFCP